MANVVIFCGSVRHGRMGRRVCDWLAQQLSQRGHEVAIIDPREHPELLVMERMYKSMDQPSEDMQAVRNLVAQADGYIAVTPEYNHSFSGALKNMIDHFMEEYFFKPTFIVSYSAGGFGGIRAVEPLRCVLAEVGTPAIPSSLPISKVQNVFAEDGSLQDEAYAKRLEKPLTEFEWYMDALAQKRAQGTPY